MRILHISTYDIGGAGLSCIRLHKGLLENGYNSKVLVLYKTLDVPGVYKYERSGISLPRIIRWPLQFLKLVLLKLRIPVSMYQLLQFRLDSLRKISSPVYSLPLSEYDISAHPFVKEADIIHLHWAAGFLDWPSFFKNISKFVVWTIHDENLYYGGFHYLREKEAGISDYRILEEKLVEIKQKSIRYCKNISIVSLSKMMLELSFSSKIVKERKHYVIHNMVDNNSFKRYDKKFAREVFELPQEKRVLLFISYYLNDKNKGFKELVNALNELGISDMVIFAIGIGKSEIESKTEIYYPGPINDMRLLSLAYSASDLYVMPSFQEAFAQTPLEAMACGLPVVAFPVSGTEELINEKNGIRTTDFTVGSLKNGIWKSLDNSYDNDSIRADVLSRFGVLNIVEQYLEVYRESLNEKVV